MNKLCFLMPFVLAAMTASAGERPADTGASKSCTVGPTEKWFGHTKWLLYGCGDANTAVIVTAAANPAAPFYFIVFREAGNYRIYGEGTGSKAASGAALKQLQALSGAALANLVSEANRAKP